MNIALVNQLDNHFTPVLARGLQAAGHGVTVVAPGGLPPSGSPQPAGRSVAQVRSEVTRASLIGHCSSRNRTASASSRILRLAISSSCCGGSIPQRGAKSSRAWLIGHQAPQVVRPGNLRASEGGDVVVCAARTPSSEGSKCGPGSFNGKPKNLEAARGRLEGERPDVC
jgi:hypothetical protein